MKLINFCQKQKYMSHIFKLMHVDNFRLIMLFNSLSYVRYRTIDKKYNYVSLLNFNV